MTSMVNISVKSLNFFKSHMHIYIYPLVMTNSSPWKIPTINGAFKFGKPSISINGPWLNHVW